VPSSVKSLESMMLTAKAFQVLGHSEPACRRGRPLIDPLKVDKLSVLFIGRFECGKHFVHNVGVELHVLAYRSLVDGR
jgi:hypothetical protein